MRKIKFRAWHAGHKHAAPQMLYDERPGDCLLWQSQRQNITQVMQYTGLEDKNGREIYEGDILTSAEYPFQDDGKYNYHGVIEWIDEEASFYMTKRLANAEKRGVSNGISQPIESIEEFEVIGNIYENPELLEV